MTEQVFAVLYFGGVAALLTWGCIAAALSAPDTPGGPWGAVDAILWPLYAVRATLQFVVRDVGGFLVRLLVRAWRVATFGEGTR